MLLKGFTTLQEESLHLHWSSAVFKTSGSLLVSCNVKCFPKGDLAIAVQHQSPDKQQKSADALNLASVQSIPVLQTDLQLCFLPSNNIKAPQCVCTGNEFPENLALTYAPKNGEVMFVRAPFLVGVGVGTQSFKFYSSQTVMLTSGFCDKM